MRQEKLMDAMEFVSDELLESAANSMTEKKKVFPWRRVTALAACLALVVGLFWYNYVPPIPRYENALFTAEQIGELMPKYLGSTNVYKEQWYFNEKLFVLPEIPELEYINVYRWVLREEASEEKLREVVDRIALVLEEMYGIDTTNTTFEQDDDRGVFTADVLNDEKRIHAFSNARETAVYWYNKDRSPLMINGTEVYLSARQTDEEIEQSLTGVIAYLEQTFDMDLSACRIVRSDSYKNLLDSMSVYLYSANQGTNGMLEKYYDNPSYYSAGESLVLKFSAANENDSNDMVVCSSIWYSIQKWPSAELYTQCRMISLAEAELLLDRGYVFSDHVCKLCMAMQDQVDFSDYDRVSLEYMFGRTVNDYGIPFYTFYKKISEDEDGVVQYAKTMVPAIEVSGLEEYFEEQEKYHRD